MKRWSKRVAPQPTESDEYIQKRYQDTSVCIRQDIRLGRELYSNYVPWFQEKLVIYISSDHFRQKYWLEQVPLYSNQKPWADNSNTVPTCESSIVKESTSLRTNHQTRNTQSSICILL